MKNRTVLLTLIVCLVFALIAFVSTFDDGTLKCENIDEIVNGYNTDEMEGYHSVKWEQKEITGNVKVPGIYEVSSEVNFIELIGYAGGIKNLSPRVILEILTENNEIDDKDREIMIKSQ